MSLREAELFKVIDELTRVHREWVSDDNRPHPDSVYWDAVTDVLSAFEHGDIPGTCRDLEEAVGQLRSAVDVFDARDNFRDHYPQDEFWQAREKLEFLRAERAQAPERRPLEPLAELKKLPGISDEQIAKMWGFVDRHGRAMPWLVTREMEIPGSVTKTPGAVDGRDWIDPRDAREQKERHEERRKTTASMAKKQKVNERKNRPATESPRDLWELNPQPSLEQASRMLNMPAERIRQLWDGYTAELHFRRGTSDMDTARIVGRPVEQIEAMRKAWEARQAEPANEATGAVEGDAPGITREAQIGEPDYATHDSEVSDEELNAAKVQEIRELAREGFKEPEIAQEVGRPVAFVKSVLSGEAVEAGK